MYIHTFVRRAMWWYGVSLWVLGALRVPMTEGQTFQVRLVGGTNSSNGRVEVNNGVTWGTVCDDNWEDQDATVVCRMRGYSRGVALVSVNGIPPFGAGAGIIALDDVNCFGPEVNIAQCQHRGWAVHDCDHTEDAGVQCIGTPGNPIATTTRRPATPGPVPDNCPGNQPSPNVRLYGTVAGIGIVEVFNSALNQWGSICDDNFGQRDAMVICRMLCYDVRNARAGARADMVQATPRLPIQLDNLGCTGSENDIFNCPSNGWGTDNCNDTTEVVRVTCIPQDYLAPPPPIPSVSCANALILASFNRTTYPDIEDKHLDVNNSPPNCNVRKRTTTTVAEIAIPFDECDTVKELNATHIVYKNTVRIASTYLQNNVYRKNTYLVHLACDFPRAGDVNDNGVQPLTESVSQRAPGQYNFRMTFYRNDNFTQEETVFPIRIPLGEFLNVGVSLEDVDTGLKLIVPNCRASPTLDPNSNVMYPLISDRCPTDPALAVFPWNRTAFAFRFQTIRFLGNNPVFYVTCDTFVCTVAEKNADCDQSCETVNSGRRRRRRHVSDAGHTMYHVVGGPFRVIGSDDVIQHPLVDVHRVSTTASGTLITAPSPPQEPPTSGSASSNSTPTPRGSHVSQQSTGAHITTQSSSRHHTLAVRTISNGASSSPSSKVARTISPRSTTASSPSRITPLEDSGITIQWTGRPHSVNAPTTSPLKPSQRSDRVNIVRVPQKEQTSNSIRETKAPSSENRVPTVEAQPQSNSETDSKIEQRVFLPEDISGILDGAETLRNPISIVVATTSLIVLWRYILF